MEEDREQPFAAFVRETLARRGAELGHSWAEHARLILPADDRPLDDGRASGAGAATAERLVRSLIDSALGDTPGPADVRAHRAGAEVDPGSRGERRVDPVTRLGRALGAGAYRANTTLRQMLEGLDLLEAVLLRAAERAAREHGDAAAGHEGVALARRISGTISSLRLAATQRYAQAVEDDLRKRYRAIRHDLRNPLGTIKSAVALLTDESVSPEMRQSARVRAMVARNASSLDRMIGEALGDAAARLPAFRAPREVPRNTSHEAPSYVPARPAASGRKQRDDLARARQRPDLESGAL